MVQVRVFTQQAGNVSFFPEFIDLPTSPSRGSESQKFGMARTSLDSLRLVWLSECGSESNLHEEA